MSKVKGSRSELYMDVNNLAAKGRAQLAFGPRELEKVSQNFLEDRGLASLSQCVCNL